MSNGEKNCVECAGPYLIVVLSVYCSGEFVVQERVSLLCCVVSTGSGTKLSAVCNRQLATEMLRSESD
jgi:hypothetical protein